MFEHLVVVKMGMMRMKRRTRMRRMMRMREHLISRWRKFRSWQ